MFGKEEVNEARKRCILKRYLTRMEIPFKKNWPTRTLRHVVKQAHKKASQAGRLRFAWPLTHGEIMSRVKQNHYVKQLVTLKVCFGHHAGCGFVSDAGSFTCQTIAEMAAKDLAPQSMVYLDQHMHRLKVI